MTALCATTGQDDPFVHEGLFYRDADEYLAGMVPFVTAGLEADEPVLVAVPEENLGRIQSALGPAGARVRFRDMTVAGRNPGRIIPTVLLAFVAEHRGRRVRIIGEPIWAGRTDTEYPACVQHEALINVALAGHPATILCPYDSSRLDPAVIADARGTHPVLVDGVRRTACDGYRDPLELAAAFDRPPPAPSGPVATLGFGPGDLAALRDFVADQAALAGLAPTRALHLRLAVNELAVNTIDHSGGSGTLRIWRDGHSLICEVSDPGRLSDPLAGRRQPPRPDTDGGRGLLLAHSLCDLVTVHTHPTGTAVRLHVRL